MTTLRALSIFGLSALLLAGCSTTACHKCKQCDGCSDGAVYYNSTAPMPDSGALLTPPPMRAPMPVPEVEPLPEAPPPPGTTETERPSRLRAMRDTTEGLFRTAGENVRAVFTR